MATCFICDLNTGTCPCAAVDAFFSRAKDTPRAKTFPCLGCFFDPCRCFGGGGGEASDFEMINDQEEVDYVL